MVVLDVNVDDVHRGILLRDTALQVCEVGYGGLGYVGLGEIKLG